ncbi:hypothetical protein D1007_40208 [Hordeum vulgare]|nr:hypothetical protein D1007_40208 [Hordeum vulgare]
MHYFGPKSVLYLACLATLCEGYLGVSPFPALFHLFFHFCTRKNYNVSYSYGRDVVYAQRNWLFPKMGWIDSFKKWHRSFFYVRNIEEGRDWVNLPPFADTPLIGANWNHEVRNDEMTMIASRLKELKASRGLLTADLVAAFIYCLVLPLQERTHEIYDMGMYKDPCRLSNVELLPNKVATSVNTITRFWLDMEAWWFGMEPFYHENHAS